MVHIPCWNKNDIYIYIYVIWSMASFLWFIWSLRNSSSSHPSLVEAALQSLEEVRSEFQDRLLGAALPNVELG